MIYSSSGDIQKQIISGIIKIFCIVNILSFVFMHEPIPFIYGLVFGTCLSILNFKLMARSMIKAAGLSVQRAYYYALSAYMVRYFVTGLVLIISIQADYINAIGTITGLLLIKVLILGNAVLPEGRKNCSKV